LLAASPPHTEKVSRPTCARSRVEEWRQFFKDHARETVWENRAVRFRLDDAAALAAINLTRREKTCCTFFDFRLTILADAVGLEVKAPEEATSILDSLFALGTAESTRPPSER
jgi:hypothetical protein